MAINESWIPAILQGVDWAVEKIKTKKSLSVKVSELQEEVHKLTESNQALSNNIDEITKAILFEFQNKQGYSINGETIVYIGSNSGNINTVTHTEIPLIPTKQVIQSESDSKKGENINAAGIFDGIDAEILREKEHRPSERRS